MIAGSVDVKEGSMTTAERLNLILSTQQANASDAPAAIYNLENNFQDLYMMMQMAAGASAQGDNQGAASLLNGGYGITLSSLLSNIKNNIALLSGTSYAGYSPYFSSLAAECSALLKFSSNQYTPVQFANIEGTAFVMDLTCHSLCITPGGAQPSPTQMAVLIDLGQLFGLSDSTIGFQNPNDITDRISAILQASENLSDDLSQINPPLNPLEQSELSNVQNDIASFLANPSDQGAATALSNDVTQLINQLTGNY